MNIDFIAAVKNSSGTPSVPSILTEIPHGGFREQINRAMRDNGRKNEYPVEKNSDERKKQAADGQQRNSAKTDAPKNNDRPEHEYTEKNSSAASPTDDVEETSETTVAKYAPSGDDSGFLDEFEEAGISETINASMSASMPAEASETENIYSYVPVADNTAAPDDLNDAFASFSSDDVDPQFFSTDLMNDDPELAIVENAADNPDTSAVPVAAPVAVTEVISQMIADQITASTAAGTTDGNNQQNVSLANPSNEGAEADAKNLSVESAGQGGKGVLENELFQNNQSFEQNPGRNTETASRAEVLREEIQAESKAAANTEPQEASKPSVVRELLEENARLQERMAEQMTRSREGAVFLNASENTGKTVQPAETVQPAVSAAAKPETPVPARPVNVPDQKFVFELAGRIRSLIQGGREMLRIQLQPEHLGRLEIRAESGRNGIIASIAAESIEAKKLLENNIQSLQQTLDSRGLKVDRIHIVVDENMYTAFADDGRYGNAGKGSRNAQADEFSKPAGAGIKSLYTENVIDLSTEAEQRGVKFYTVG